MGQKKALGEPYFSAQESKLVLFIRREDPKGLYDTLDVVRQDLNNQRSARVGKVDVDAAAVVFASLS